MEKAEIIGKIKEYCNLEEYPHFVHEIEELVRNEAWDELSDRFYRDLDFGTGGLRGVIGGGTNRINPLNIRKATAGLAAYVKRHAGESAKAVIAHDSRRYSDLFAEQTALVFCAFGIKTYLFSSLRPTPILSYAVRQLGCSTGVVVTASHNPPEYNGYKVYWDDGCQIVPPHDKEIIREVRQVSGKLPTISKTEALEKGLLVIIDKEVDEPYYEMIKAYISRPELLAKMGSSVKLVYTPLHGTGTVPIERLFSDLGIHVVTVPEQREPDGNFPTVDYPNPEEASAMAMSVALGKKEKADIVMGTDPDADRFGIAVPDGEEFRLITGNQLGSLLCDYILRTRQEMNRMPENPVVVKTIVTTELQRLIAESYGAECLDVLTGFKYIGEKMGQFEKTGQSYVFGGEESYGYLVETEVRDKDAVSAALLTAEMTLWNRSLGRTVIDHLNELYTRHGYFREILVSKVFSGQEGGETMKALMKNLRTEPPKVFGGSDVVRVIDYAESENTGLPSSNVLQFILLDKSVVTVRPSGTEPKIKIYASCRAEAGLDLTESEKRVSRTLEEITKDINRIFS